MCFKVLNAVLRLYEANFRNLHWNAAGNDFNDSHKSISTEYYEMIGETIDQVSEMMIMLGIEDIPNYMQVKEILDADENKYCLIDTTKIYSRADIIALSDTMLGDICRLLTAALDEEILKSTENAGIKSEFESILYQYGLQYRYINRRRNMKQN